MSLNQGNLTEADHIPGAFPSEDAAAVGTGLDTQSIQKTPLDSNEITTGGHADEKKREFLEQQEAAHTAGGQQNESPLGGASSQDKTLSQDPAQTGLEASTPTSGVRTGETLSNATGQQSSNAPTTTQNSGSITSDLATMATAVGLAAKDALVAAKDSAVPAASAATEQAKNLAGYAQENAGPAASYAAEQAGNAATYTKDTVTSGVSNGSSTETVPTEGAMQTAGNAATYAKDTAYSAANAAQSYAPNVLGEPSSTSSNTRDSSTLENPLSQAGESRDATTNAEPATKPHVDLTSRVKGLEEQLAPESMTPGVVTVLGTEQDRSFPLGATDHVVST